MAENKKQLAENELQNANSLPEKTQKEKEDKIFIVNDAFQKLQTIEDEEVQVRLEIEGAEKKLEKAKIPLLLLITGFDPFILNPTKRGNPLQSNPSGVNALALHGKRIGDYNIQTCMCPVRYADFDDFKSGEGIIETFIKPFISKVDMIITASQGDVYRLDVDRFPCKHRGGYMDNMFRGNSSPDYNSTGFKQLTTGKEFYETTLPYDKMVHASNNPVDKFWVYFNQTFETTSLLKVNTTASIQGTQLIEKMSSPVITGLADLQTYPSKKGSGGDYLSNEIFYRVAKLRQNIADKNGKLGKLPTGHLHVPLIQYGLPIPAPRGNVVTSDLNPDTKALVDKIKDILLKL